MKCWRAAERLTELSGDMVMPLEQEISKATTKLFPAVPAPVWPAGRKAEGLELPGSDRWKA